jgi:hypothetical protein
VVVQRKTIRTSIDLPRDLHRRLHEVAARRGCSARKLILDSIEQTVAQNEAVRPRRRLNLDKPLVPRAGRKPFDLTNEQIYDLLEFP